MEEVTVALPRRWAPVGSGGGQIGNHTGVWHDDRLTIRPAPGTAYIEQILSTLFLDHLGEATPRWLLPWEDARQTAAAADDVLAVSGPTIRMPGWTDRYLYSADLAHRLLFERRFDHDRPGTCVWVLFNAGVGDLLQKKKGGRRTTPQRGNLGRAVALTRGWAASPPSDEVDWQSCGSVTVVNLFTARSADVASAGTVGRTVGAVSQAVTLNHRTADRVLRQSFASATAVVGAWGRSSSEVGQSSRPGTVETIITDAEQVLYGVTCTYGGKLVRWLTDMQPRYTMGMGSDATPIPLGSLRANADLPVPAR